MPTKKAQHRYMLIDGNALIHRGFHAVPYLTNKSGEPTNAVYGFTMILLKAIKDLNPTHIACAFDLDGPTFRHEKYADYKGTRVKSAQELYDQIPRVKEVVRALNIPVFELMGFEADDVLGTLAKKICVEHKNTCDVMIATGDMDALQLVDKCVKVYTLRRGITDTAVYDEKAVVDRYGLTPSQMIDYKALRGDPSDNIKGVAGIGEKGAVALLQEFKSIDNLYKQIHANKVGDKIKPRILELLKDQEDSARLSHELATIQCDIPVEPDLTPYVFNEKALNATLDLFKELEFKSLVAQLPKRYGSNGANAVQSVATVSEVEQEKIVPSQKSWKADYVFIDTEQKLEKFLVKLKQQNEFALDTEATGLNPITARLVGVSFSFEQGTGYYISAELLKKSKELQEIIANQAVKKIGHNIKYDYAVLQNEHLTMGSVYFDTMIASYLLNAGTRQHGLDALAFNELGHQMQPIEELIGKGKDQIGMQDVDPVKVSWYAAEDADATFRLKELYQPRLKEEGVEDIFYNIEMPLIEVLASMERWGIKVDAELLNKLSIEAEKTINALEKDIYKLSGEEFNIASPKQLKEVLFEKLRLYSPDNKKTKTGLSTAAGELEKMIDQHPVIQKILEYRELTKLQSTYLLALPKLINEKTGRIHTNYNQTIAATGRLSSTDPNLQNIPVRGVGLGSEVRKAFIAEKGWTLLSLDYSQIELRVVAHIAQDKTMMRVFQNDEDIHTETAMAVFKVPADEVTPDMRRDAKTINFGILYGLSSFGLSSRIGEVGRSEAKAFIEAYFEAYPDVKRYMDSIKTDVNRDAFVKNELGRTRHFPEIKSSQFFIRAAAERAAINFPVQSLAADIIKVAMINVDKEIEGHEAEIKMLLQVHDELVFEVRENMVEKWAKKIKPIMQEAIKLSVPVRVETKVGKNWGEMDKLDI
ncbi:MAG: DNA polymerase I [Candidatus Doudnabacteria bacterium]|nr:DNA polymerase I [Candidatus Doudnabacteria bacterium]